MKRLSAFATQKLAETLDPDQRDAVLGDLVELKKTNIQIIQALFVVSIKRHLLAFAQWKPWVALAASVMLFGPILTDLSTHLGREAYVDVWMMWHNGVSFFSGVSPNAVLVGFIVQALALATWSLSCVLAMNWLSPRTSWLNASSLVAVIVLHSYDLRVPFAREYVLLTTIVPVGFAFVQKWKPTGKRTQWLAWSSVWTLVIGVSWSWVHGWRSAAVNSWGHGTGVLSLPDLLRRRDAWPTSFHGLSTAVLFTLPMLYLLLAARDREHTQQIATD